MYHTIDTRDLVEELSKLTGCVDLWENYVYDEEWGLSDAEHERCEAIVLLFADVSDYASDRPEDGIQLIPESDFEEFARDLADDLGLIPREYSWPTSCIDWEQAAKELQQDYTSVTFDGIDYLYR